MHTFIRFQKPESCTSDWNNIIKLRDIQKHREIRLNRRYDDPKQPLNREEDALSQLNNCASAAGVFLGALRQAHAPEPSELEFRGGRLESKENFDSVQFINLKNTEHAFFKAPRPNGYVACVNTPSVKPANRLRRTDCVILPFDANPDIAKQLHNLLDEKLRKSKSKLQSDDFLPALVVPNLGRKRDISKARKHLVSAFEELPQGHLYHKCKDQIYDNNDEAPSLIYSYNDVGEGQFHHSVLILKASSPLSVDVQHSLPQRPKNHVPVAKQHMHEPPEGRPVAVCSCSRFIKVPL